MKKIVSLTSATLTLLLLCSSLAGQDEKEKKKNEIVEHYTGVVVATGGVLGGRTMRIDLRIQDYTTDDQVIEYLRILKEDGQDALRRVLEKVKMGNLSPSFSVGNDVAVVRAFDLQDGTRVIRVISARTMPFLELYYGGRSTDYPFGLIELRVDSEGKGQGSIIGGAQFKLKDNELEIESYGNQYLKLTNVTRSK